MAMMVREPSPAERLRIAKEAKEKIDYQIPVSGTITNMHVWVFFAAANMFYSGISLSEILARTPSWGRFDEALMHSYHGLREGYNWTQLFEFDDQDQPIPVEIIDKYMALGDEVVIFRSECKRAVKDFVAEHALLASTDRRKFKELFTEWFLINYNRHYPIYRGSRIVHFDDELRKVDESFRYGSLLHDILWSAVNIVCLLGGSTSVELLTSYQDLFVIQSLLYAEPIDVEVLYVGKEQNSCSHSYLELNGHWICVECGKELVEHVDTY
jgi:hypothetical protein